MDKELLAFQLPSSELFIGLVGPVGTDTDAAMQLIKQALGAVNYNIEHISISRLIEDYVNVNHSGVLDRYDKLMSGGDKLRSVDGLNRGDALAVATIIEVWNRRQKKIDEMVSSEQETNEEENSSINEQDQSSEKEPPKPLARTAFIFDQLKHHKEVETLRWVYGSSFFLVAAYTPTQTREQRLIAKLQSNSAEDKEKLKEDARNLMKRDERSGKLGQNVQKTFPLADAFINTARSDEAVLSLKRFLELILGHPFHTPTKDEQGMFFAKSAALRSADLARQIGASITNETGDLLAVGCNDAAKAGGGQYWTGDNPDNRDFRRGYDENDLSKKRLLKDVLNKLNKAKWTEKHEDEIAKIVSETFSMKDAPLREADLMSIIEYFRSVHAELAALMTCARLGISVKDAILYSTTFPCHECARHIVAAGIKRVVYIEPYPKSRVAELYPDSISVDKEEANHVPFLPFVGIAPRIYFDLYQLGTIIRKTDDGKVVDWDAFTSEVRLGQTANSYLYKEARFVNQFGSRFELWSSQKLALGENS